MFILFNARFHVVLCSIVKPVDPATWLTAPIPADFPIQIDEDKETVTVAAGISQRALMEYLAAFTYWKQPLGWTLPAFSWFIDQSIGGAIATGTHGSSMQWGSLSSQLVGLKVILANGTLLEFESPTEDPHLWHALAVSVGRLGVITDVTMRIVPNEPVTRIGKEMSFNDFVDELQVTQDAYKAALAANDSAAVDTALSQVDETMVRSKQVLL